MPISIRSRTRIKNADSEGQGSNLTKLATHIRANSTNEWKRVSVQKPQNNKKEVLKFKKTLV